MWLLYTLDARTPPEGSKGGYEVPMLTIEIDREEDGRWIGEISELPGVLAYGATEAEARTKVAALALHVIADRIEHGEPVPINPQDLFVGV
jgi:predicted RNase H-like HicB family nuclease